MISLDPTHPFHSAVLEILITHPGLTTSQLKHKLEKDYNLKTSQPTLYRLTTGLLESHMLIRTKGRFWINHLWATHIQRIAHTIDEVYFSKKSIEDCLALKEGESRKIKGSSLKDMDPQWNHTLIAIKALYPTEPFCVYSSHPAYGFPISENEQRLFTSCLEKGGILRWFGNDNFLDKKGAKVYQEAGAKTLTSTNHSFPKEGISIWVCGDYIVEMLFPDQIKKYLELIFRSVKSEKDFDPDFFFTLYETKV
ncbi:MAG TPA: hypothetical protein VIT68_05030, partial [Candidatus Gracilibacteria bacterium]